MREILFRGKKINNGEWVMGNLFIPDKDDTPTQICIGTNIIRIPYDIIPKTVGQYTGLTDKNSKKIFEGDILSTENGTFSNTGMGYICLYKGMWVSFYGQDALGRDCYDELYTICNTREIIGNIHDNPELY